MYQIIADECKGCSKMCPGLPRRCHFGKVKEPFVIDTEKCIKCGACKEACRFGAVERLRK